ncbi:hypothetical protein HNY73_004424 [Argiope bruennichi]|uniref:Uncharacterized protein n=1 Tax=Argiope bruennichi TaxID=94029 RepID=A0A8T0FTP3_ARGBR|nr:hypothetical protein HNY73_004424 [Argiope bruennichi]
MLQVKNPNRVKIYIVHESGRNRIQSLGLNAFSDAFLKLVQVVLAAGALYHSPVPVLLSGLERLLLVMRIDGLMIYAILVTSDINLVDNVTEVIAPVHASDTSRSWSMINPKQRISSWSSGSYKHKCFMTQCRQKYVTWRVMSPKKTIKG